MALHLALETDGAGAHPAAWRFGDPANHLRPAAIRDVVLAAESAGFALATFADSPVPRAGAVGRLESVGRAAFVSTRTTAIGLAPAVPTATVEPFHLAAQIASLDHATRGRAAWVVTGTSPAALATVGLEEGPASEVVAAVRALWDSWEDDAVIKDVASGRYLDADKVHHVDFEGSSFTVKGPLITPRPPQGQPVVIADAGLALDADIALIPADEVGRARPDSLVFAELEVVLDTDVPAESRLAALDAAAEWGSSRTRYVGSAVGLVELLGELSSSVDGVLLHPAALAVDLPVLTRHVLPALDLAPRRPTLRETLGLPKPVNRFARAGL
ncbi:LLM class flavin-dependent oxidoreductase [Actinokineospora auranticolor]|uniref:Luciferase-like monooxygenase n=1 Tax=Actinokineospora auranticolor TaxID=155976 RepID=A0A2S6GF89_9PSEU|nr:LLM class flavin-dependent oxidoreductase [Actinokineospora auranticolor]PPK63882.1 luciferase-like monooxygenase [Actinokineospora auranticolor]